MEIHTAIYMLRNSLLTLLFTFSFIALLAQSVGPVYFQSGAERFSANVNEFVRQPVPAYDVNDQRYHRWVQFTQTPTAKVRAQFEAQGLRFLAYIPHGTYLVSFPARYDRTQLLNTTVHAVVRPTSQHKTSHLLVEESPLAPGKGGFRYF